MADLKSRSVAKKQRDPAILILNAALLAVAVVFVVVVGRRFDSRIRDVSLNESRFLLTEWHLLQTLKAETELQLLQKDEEIAILMSRIDELSDDEANQAELQVLRDLLRSVEEEREQIASRRATVADDAVADTDGNNDAAAAQTTETGGAEALPPSGVRDMLELRILELETVISGLERRAGEDAIAIDDYQATVTDFVGTLNEYRARFDDYERAIATLEGTVAGLEDRISAYEESVASYRRQVEDYQLATAALEGRVEQYESEISDYEEAVADMQELLTNRDAAILELQTTAQERAATIDGLNLSVEQAAAELAGLQSTLDTYLERVAALSTDLASREAGVADTTPSPESLRTWALLKALLSTQSIRSQYPDLLESMESYMDTYAERNRNIGLREAYRTALEQVDGLGTD